MIELTNWELAEIKLMIERSLDRVSKVNNDERSKELCEHLIKLGNLKSKIRIEMDRRVREIINNHKG